MEEKKGTNKGLWIIICILAIIVMLMGGYIVYDKVLKSDNKVSNEQKDNDNTDYTRIYTLNNETVKYTKPEFIGVKKDNVLEYGLYGLSEGKVDYSKPAYSINVKSEGNKVIFEYEGATYEYVAQSEVLGTLTEELNQNAGPLAGVDISFLDNKGNIYVGKVDPMNENYDLVVDEGEYIKPSELIPNLIKNIKIQKTDSNIVDIMNTPDVSAFSGGYYRDYKYKDGSTSQLYKVLFHGQDSLEINIKQDGEIEGFTTSKGDKIYYKGYLGFENGNKEFEDGLFILDKDNRVYVINAYDDYEGNNYNVLKEFPSKAKVIRVKEEKDESNYYTGYNIKIEFEDGTSVKTTSGSAFELLQ